MKQIRFVDLPAQFAEIRTELDQVYTSILESCRFSGGPALEEFEQAFAAYCTANWCVGVASGTEALRLALVAHEIGAGDEVITVPNTFFATAAAISAVGATPVFTPIDSDTLLMRCDAVEERLTERTKAIIPVHLFGSMVDVSQLNELAKDRDIAVIEDCAQAHGAICNGVIAGGSENTCCFSFYPGKNLGGIGEGGAVVGVDQKIERKIRALRAHGQTSKNCHEYVGLNSHLDALNASVLNIKLKRLDSWNAKRRELAQHYFDGFAEISVDTPRIPEHCSAVHHLMPVYVGAHRDRVRKALSLEKIESGCHYPVPIPFQPAYANLGYRRGEFPVAEKWAEGHLTVPMHPHLSLEDVSRVIEVVGQSHEQGSEI